eukprot:TRINITY_DN1435_c0_g2_i4.p1 TRINITY_DN1435_c0_g2~~TRINITY_DN1435_c0_g2_i4.p1  ORF type:complete len:413 (+),score=118.61 TRINITY_DN1435_c0_g2_i4:222-1460(+)
MKDITRLRNLPADQITSLRKTGLQLIGEGRVAVLLLSGGQGSRLGFEHAKGMYNIGLPSQKTLFQIFSERLGRLNALAAKNGGSGRVTFYIMTSDGNDREVRVFFETNGYFGLPAEDVVFFTQDSLPAIDYDGKIFLSDRGQAFLAPNGNGGVYTSLENSGTLAHMEKRGIRYVHVVGVDNVLARLADPLFIGFAASRGFEITSKFVAKAHAKENVGVHVLKNGKPHIIEYSEITEQQAEEVDENGDLRLGAANIVNVVFTVDFLRRIVTTAREELLSQFHVARKKIRYYDDKVGTTLFSNINNGYKFELFMFDVYGLASSMGLLETRREEEFAPVKNAPGSKEDSPDTARILISRLHQKWLRDAGVVFAEDADGVNSHLCEVSPLVSYDGEGLNEVAQRFTGQKVQLPFAI